LRYLSLIVVVTVVAVFTLMPRLRAQTSRGAAGEVIAIRELQLKPGVDVAEFERFVRETYNPSWQAAVPGMRGYIAKGDRGQQKGTYVLVFVFDSEKTRNTIFPKEGGGASGKFTALLEAPFSLGKTLEAYIEAGTLSVYTDYIALR
jgi:hypothetical protein